MTESRTVRVNLDILQPKYEKTIERSHKQIAQQGM